MKDMISHICNIAEAHGLIDSQWHQTLVVGSSRRIPRGGKKGAHPWIGIPPNYTWHYAPDNSTRKMRDAWEKSRPCAKRTRALKRIDLALTHNKGVLAEYASIARDSDIGDLVGELTDKRAPVAAILCHEIAHAIDHTNRYIVIDNRDMGSYERGHGKRWQEIYRLLRTNYLSTGAYKKEAQPIVKKPAARLDLIGLPLFEAAA